MVSGLPKTRGKATLQLDVFHSLQTCAAAFLQALWRQHGTGDQMLRAGECLLAKGGLAAQLQIPGTSR